MKGWDLENWWVLHWGKLSLRKAISLMRNLVEYFTIERTLLSWSNAVMIPVNWHVHKRKKIANIFSKLKFKNNQVGLENKRNQLAPHPLANFFPEVNICYWLKSHSAEAKGPSGVLMVRWCVLNWLGRGAVHWIWPILFETFRFLMESTQKEVKIALASKWKQRGKNGNKIGEYHS